MSEQVAQPAASRAGKIVMFWAVVVLVVGAGTFFALREDPLLSEAKAAVRAAMKDPDSVEFRNTAVAKLGDYACGEYNAKNSFGAYAGYRPFLYGKKDGLNLAADPTLIGIVCK